MFPINRSGLQQKNGKIVLYIPLCFLLIHYQIIHQSTVMFLYIPLCFLLIGLEQIKDALIDILYIPLCFLLILHGTVRVTSPQRPLHSTMFPINRSKPCTEQLPELSLHSTMFPINQRPRSRGVSNDVSFTFHYVSY